MPRDIVDLVQRLAKSVPEAVVLGPAASAAAIAAAEERVGGLPASYKRLLAHSNGARFFGLDLWPVEKLAPSEGSTVTFGMAVDDGEPLWWDKSRPLGAESFTGQGDPQEPTGGGAPGVEHMLAERAWAWIDDNQEKPSKRALKVCVEHAEERGGRVGGGGITYAPPSTEAELPIVKLRGSVVRHGGVADRIAPAVAAILGGPGQVAAVETRIDYPLLHPKGRAEFAIWVEVTGDMALDKKATGAMVRVAQAVWKTGLEGRVLGDVAWLVVPGAKGPRQKHVEREPVRVDEPAIRQAVAALFERHLQEQGVSRQLT